MNFVSIRPHPTSRRPNAIPEIRPQNLRGKTYGQSKAQQQYAKAKDHYRKAVTKGVKIGNIEERKKYSLIAETWNLNPMSQSVTDKGTGSYSSIAERWDLDPIYRESIRFKNRIRRDCETWDHGDGTNDAHRTSPCPTVFSFELSRTCATPETLQARLSKL